MKQFLLLFLSILCLYACGSSKNVGTTNTPPITKKGTKKTITKKPTLADKVIWTAVTYKGAPYRLGGTTKTGMDCSGLIYTSFKKRDIILPRTSGEMYQKGRLVKLHLVKRGDLLFFKTSRKRAKVNHVGLVTSVKNGDIRFIHATSSKGVLVSSLREKYWKTAFVKAKRVL